MMGSFREYHNVNIPNSNSLFTHCLRRNQKKQRPTPKRKSL